MNESRILDGIIQVCGPHDTGKTSFALECGVPPERMMFVDDDVKGRSTVNELLEAGIEFGKYVDLSAFRQKRTEYQFHRAVMDMLAEIEPGQYDAIVWDTWTAFSKSFYSYVIKHQKEFREFWSSMGRIKAGEQWQEARAYEANVLGKLGSLARTVILVTHLKNFYANNVQVPGKQVPDSGPTLERVPRMRLWLQRNPSGRPVPQALVLKRLDRKLVENGRIRTVSVLPQKLVPNPDEHSLWDTIWRYWDNPVGDREPTPEELPDAYEYSIIESSLTSDQKHTLDLLLSMDADVDFETEDEEPDEELAARVHELHEAGEPNGTIAKEVGLSVPEVLKIVRDG